MAALHRKVWGAQQGGRRQKIEKEEKILKSLVYAQKQESVTQRRACSRDCSSNSRLVFGRWKNQFYILLDDCTVIQQCLLAGKAM